MGRLERKQVSREHIRLPHGLLKALRLYVLRIKSWETSKELNDLHCSITLKRSSFATLTPNDFSLSRQKLYTSEKNVFEGFFISQRLIFSSVEPRHQARLACFLAAIRAP